MGVTVKQFTESEQGQVRDSLARVFASPMFVGSLRLQRFLDYLVTNTMAGESDRLKGYTIGLEVFDREDDFDPSVDAIVRVEATRLRNKLREYYDTPSANHGGKEDPIRIDFPKGSYTLEISLQAARQEERRVATIQAPNVPRKIMDKPSLAILPFANIGVDDSKEYFADGVVDSLIAMFSRLSGIFVISRLSAFAYKNTKKTSEEISTELGVRYLLEGSVQHAGDQVRINAQLVDTLNDGQVWSECFDRELKEIFTLQDELTQSIVRVLQIKLAGEETKCFGVQQTDSIEAYDYLLQGVSKHRFYTEKKTNEAIELYKCALNLDPNFAATHAWLARSIMLIWSQKWNDNPALLEQALFHARRAVELEPQSAFAYSILSWVYLWLKNKEGSITEGRRAVELDPNNAEAYLFLSLALSSAGLADEALFYIEKAGRFNPVPDAFYKWAHGNCYYVKSDYTKAITLYEQGKKINANFKPNLLFVTVAYNVLGQHEKAQERFKALVALEGGADVDDIPFQMVWTDETLASQQELRWQQVVAAYAKVLDA